MNCKVSLLLLIDRVFFIYSFIIRKLHQLCHNFEVRDNILYCIQSYVDKNLYRQDTRYIRFNYEMLWLIRSERNSWMLTDDASLHVILNSNIKNRILSFKNVFRRDINHVEHT